MQSGAYDYTFGPGSPGATREDYQTYVGGQYSPAGGFAREGGYALAPQDYYSFTPEQRQQYGIMDIAPSNQRGQLERYYAGSTGSGSSQSADKSFWDYLNPFGHTSQGGSGTGDPTQRNVGKVVGTATNMFIPGLGFVTGPIARWITSKIQAGGNPQQVIAHAQQQGKLPPMPSGSVSLPTGSGGGSALSPTGQTPRGREYWSPDFGRGSLLGPGLDPGDYNPAGPGGPLGTFGITGPSSPAGGGSFFGGRMNPNMNLAGSWYGLGASGGNLGHMGDLIGRNEMMHVMRGGPLPAVTPAYQGFASMLGSAPGTYGWTPGLAKYYQTQGLPNAAALYGQSTFGNLSGAGRPMTKDQ